MKRRFALTDKDTYEACAAYYYVRSSFNQNWKYESEHWTICDSLLHGICQNILLVLAQSMKDAPSSMITITMNYLEERRIRIVEALLWFHGAIWYCEAFGLRFDCTVDIHLSSSIFQSRAAANEKCWAIQDFDSQQCIPLPHRTRKSNLWHAIYLRRCFINITQLAMRGGVRTHKSVNKYEGIDTRIAEEMRNCATHASMNVRELILLLGPFFSSHILYPTHCVMNWMMYVRQRITRRRRKWHQQWNAVWNNLCFTPISYFECNTEPRKLTFYTQCAGHGDSCCGRPNLSRQFSLYHMAVHSKDEKADLRWAQSCGPFWTYPA